MPLDRQPLASRGLRPVADLAKTRPHGDRLRYLAGCRCDDCRRANTAYERMRAAERKAGNWNGIVAAENARRHLAALSRNGVGRRSVGDASGVADSILVEIISGRKKNIRALTERAILAVGKAAAADHALVSAGDTWRLLDELIADGYSRAELARQLGYKTPALQLNRRSVTVRNAFDVQRLHARLRKTNAGASVRLLDDLVNEGYARRQILDGLAHLAARSGLSPPDICVRNGRIRADAAAFVKRLHEQLTA